MASHPDSATSPDLTFEDVLVENSLHYDVVLNGTFKPDIPSVTFNFVLRGPGRSAGSASMEHCTPVPDAPTSMTFGGTAIRSNNLPTAVARPDIQGHNAKEIWETLLGQANIVRSGAFHEPEVNPW